MARYGPHRDPEARRRILDATRDIVASEGPGGASIGAIAAAAGSGRQTIYRWWPSRTALVAEALEEVFERESSFPVTDDPADDLRVQMRSTAKLMRSPAGAMLRELLSEAQRDDEAAELFRERFFDRRREHARDAVERGMSAGVFRADVDVITAIDLLYAPLWLRLLAGHAPLTPAAVDRIAALAFEGLVGDQPG
ncbi:MAG: TetR-like C-terminal domain-containing protein [Actinomycetota bacterium]